MGRVLFLFVALLLVADCGCVKHRPKPPEPGPTPNPVIVSPETAAEGAIAKLRVSFAENFSAMATKIRSGELKDANQAYTFIAKANEASRATAFAEVEELVDAKIGGDRWNPELAASVFTELAKGYRGK